MAKLQTHNPKSKLKGGKSLGPCINLCVLVAASGMHEDMDFFFVNFPALKEASMRFRIRLYWHSYKEKDKCYLF
jgi:hypothetical protein